MKLQKATKQQLIEYIKVLEEQNRKLAEDMATKDQNIASVQCYVDVVNKQITQITEENKFLRKIINDAINLKRMVNELRKAADDIEDLAETFEEED